MRGARRWRLGAAVAIAAGLSGCRDPGAGEGGSTGSTGADSSTGPAATADETAEPPRERASMIDHELWERVEMPEDPIAAHRPDDVSCGVDGAFVEVTGYEVDTSLCNYLAAWQPSLVEVRAGDRISISAFHDGLSSVDAATGHFAVLLGGEILWDQVIPIPPIPESVPATPFSAELEVDVDLPAGTPVGLHVHNHGFNTWKLLHVEVIPPGA